MIAISGLTKRYSDVIAVDDLTLGVPLPTVKTAVGDAIARWYTGKEENG